MPLVRRHGREPRGRPRRPRRSREGYDYSGHGKAGHDHTDFVPDEIVDRFRILGDEEAHIARLQELQALGVDQFSIYLMHDQKDETLSAYGQRVIPAINGERS